MCCICIVVCACLLFGVCICVFEYILIYVSVIYRTYAVTNIPVDACVCDTTCVMTIM